MPTLSVSENGAMTESAAAPRRVLRPRWEKFCQETVQVKVEVTRWPGKIVLDLQDLGFPSDTEFLAVADRILGVGHQFLLPERYHKRFNTLSERLHRVPRKWALRSPWGEGCWLVPRSEFANDLRELERLKAELLALVDHIVANRDEGECWLSEMRTDFRELVKVRMAIQAGIDVRMAHEVYGSSAHAEVVEAAVDRIIDGDPTRGRSGVLSAEDLRSRFSVAWIVEEIERPDVLASGVSVSELEKRAAAAEAHLVYLDQEIEEKRQRTQETENWAEQQAALDRQRELARLAVSAEQKRLESEHLIQQEVLRSWEEGRRHQIDTLLTDASKTLLEMLHNTATEVADAVQRGQGKVHSRSLESLGVLVSKVRTFNAIFEDAEIEKLADAIQAAAREAKVSGMEAGRSLTTFLGDVKVLASSELVKLRKATRCELGVELKPIPPVRLGLARRRLALDPAPVGTAPAEPVAVEAPKPTRRGRRVLA